MLDIYEGCHLNAVDGALRGLMSEAGGGHSPRPNVSV